MTAGNINATAIEHGVDLATKDRAIAEHDRTRSLVVWQPPRYCAC